MDEYQSRAATTQTSRVLTGGFPYPKTAVKSIPLPIIPTPLPPYHQYYTHTTVVLPVRQTKVVNPAIIYSPCQQRFSSLPSRNHLDEFAKTDYRQIQLKRQRERQSAKEKAIEQMVEKHELMINELCRTSRKVKQQNEHLRIQNSLLQEKLRHINDPLFTFHSSQQRNKPKIDDVYETDVDSEAYEENRVRRIRSFEHLNYDQSTHQNFYEPCLVKCCTKCLRNVMGAKNTQQKHQATGKLTPKLAHNRQYRNFEQKTNPSYSYKDKIVAKSRNYEKNRNEFDRLRQQDINVAIKRLKKQNQMLKKYI